MKKIYALAIASMFAGSLTAQTPFWDATSYKGAFPITDLTPATDWTSGWANFDPENTAYGDPTVTVSSDITTNTTWSTGTIILLQNKIYVKNNAVLTIQPGVIVRGDYATQGTLIITKGAKINAQGTAADPIIFTSAEPVGSRAEGDWGGVVILGNAKMNQPGGVGNIEGIAVSADTEYGGSNDQDSSGVFTYVRIEFPGIPLVTGKEINGLTMGSVGSKTVIHHVQISFSGDDGFEWFGGTVDAKHLISFRTLDDDFDTDFGYSGRVQYGLIVRDADLSDNAGDSNGFESDNDANGTAVFPRTSAIFSNITSIGPKRNGTVTLPAGEKFERAFYIRRNSSISIFNSIAASWEKGIYVKDLGTTDNFSTNDSAVFGNNLIASDITKAITVDAASGATQSFYSTLFTADNDDSTKTVTEIGWVNAFPAALNTTPDYRLQVGSVAATGALFSDPKFAGQVLSIHENTNVISDVYVYPNPANDVVTVNFNLAKEAVVNANVYDITGKTVATLYNGQMNSGANTFTVNVSELPAGIYFTTISSNEGNKTMKLVVVK